MAKRRGGAPVFDCVVGLDRAQQYGEIRFTPPTKPTQPGIFWFCAWPSARDTLAKRSSGLIMAFDQQALSLYKEKLLIMASHAEGMVTRAVRAHIDRDEALAGQALETDETIDQFE
ncbi:MAG: hypothetical protein HOH62_11040, partial [Verrucomicrobia bacterium]|nr:hypothetical protein [Verrucomicrobiota bacterium]